MLSTNTSRKTTTARFYRRISRAFSLNDARAQLNAALSHFGAAVETIDEVTWKRVVPLLLEIISHVPLKISPKNKRLVALRQSIRARPLKGASVVEELSVIRLATSMFGTNAPLGHVTYCLQVTTTDTTRFVTPVAWV